MKLDMGQAWDEATALLKGNMNVLATILGLFYFLPSFAIALLVPTAAEPAQADIPPGASPQQAIDALSEVLQRQYADNWLYLLLATLMTYIGALAVLSLLTDRRRPTVGEAIRFGLVGTPTYLATQIIFGLGAAVLIGLPTGLGLAVGLPAIGLLGFIGLIVVVYAAIKLLLVPTVIGIEGRLNPFAVIVRSWRLTTGNSFRLLVFLLLLFVTAGVILVIVTLVLGAVFAAFGDPVTRIGNGFVSSMTNAVIGGLYLLVLAAVHRQLAGPPDDTLAETFE